MRKRIATILTFLLIAINVFTVNVNAAVEAVLVKNEKSNELYQYSFNEIITDYVNWLRGDSSPLYNEFIGNSKNILALKDDTKGYVNFQLIIQEYVKALTYDNMSSFNINNIASNADSSSIYTPKDTIHIRKVTGGQVNDGSSVEADMFDVLRIY